MARKLSVLQILPNLEGGGVERGTLEVAAELVRHGHRSLVMSGGGRMVPALVAQGSQHLEWPIGRKSLWTLRLVLPLRRLLREQQIDILHLRSRLPAWIAYLAWRGMDPAERPHLVTTVHGLYSVSPYSAIMTRGERIIAVSETVRRYILDNYPKVDEERIRVIPRGVDDRDFPHGYQPSTAWLDAWRQEYPQLNGKLLLTLAGRLTRLKNHHAFIDLIARLKEKGHPVHGLIVGGEDPRRREYAAEIRSKVKTLGLEDSITFTGHRSDIREIYAISAIVYSLSSKPESFGRTVVEALSLGVPVIGYAHGGVGEILGELFPEGRVALADDGQLALISERFLQQPPTIHPVTGYRLQSMLDQTLRLYHSLAG